MLMCLLSCFLGSTWAVWRCYNQCERWTSAPELRSPGEIPCFSFYPGFISSASHAAYVLYAVLLAGCLSILLSVIFDRFFHSLACMTLPVPKIKAFWNLGGFLLVLGVWLSAGKTNPTTCCQFCILLQDGESREV